MAEQTPGAELDIIGTLWAYKVGLVGCLLFGAAIGYGLSQLQPVRYTAESRVFLSSSSAFDPLDQRSSAGNQERYVVQQAELMTSRPVLDRVRLPAGSATIRDGLRDLIEVTPSADSDLVVIEATAADPRVAAALADGVALAFQEFTEDQVADAADRAVAAVTEPEQVAQIRAAAAVYGDGVSIVDTAQVPETPSQPAPLRNTVVLAVLAALVYAVVAVLPNLMWKPVVDDDEAEGVPPALPGPLTATGAAARDPGAASPGGADRVSDRGGNATSRADKLNGRADKLNGRADKGAGRGAGAVGRGGKVAGRGRKVTGRDKKTAAGADKVSGHADKVSAHAESVAGGSRGWRLLRGRRVES